MKRILFGLLLGVLMMPATFSGAMAAQARIGDFHHFECNTPDGERLKPKFGNIDGVLYTDLPAQSEACHKTIDRKIALCEQNTNFASNTEDRKHAACLPIFEKQVQACMAFFNSERVKCDSGGTSAADGESGANAQAAEDAVALSRAQRRQIQETLTAKGFDPGGADGAFGPRTRAAIRGWQDDTGEDTTGYLTEQQARVLLEGESKDESEGEGQAALLEGESEGKDESENAVPAAVALLPMCPDGTEGGRCWLEVSNKPGCYTFGYYIHEEYRPIEWSGVCENGLASGEWSLTHANDAVAAGRFVEGKRSGPWVWREADGGVAEAIYVEGKRQGRYRARYSSGTFYEGTHRNDKRHGRWIFSAYPGVVMEGSYRDGKQHGRWVKRDTADGSCDTLMYNDGDLVNVDINSC